MKFQFPLGHLPLLVMLVAGTVTFPAAAQDQAPEPAGKARDAKSTSATRSTVDAPPPENKGGPSCEQDCEVTPPAGSSTIIANPVEPQVTPVKELGTPPPPPLTMNEPDGTRRQLGYALGIGGVVAADMGSYLAIGALATQDGTQAGASSALNGFFFAGLACIGVGGGLMIGGFSMAAANRAPSTAIDRIPAVAQRRGPTDMGVSVTGRF
jgi:hypothetical protein